MSLLGRLNRPEYVLQPAATLRRLRHGRRLLGSTDVVLPWGPEITVTPDQIGRSIALTRVFDLCVTEVIHRLLGAGELAVDVGANIGYITSLMASRVGARGAVVSFEPHPAVFETLGRNVARWAENAELATIEAHKLAVSADVGVGRLGVEPHFEQHMGLSSLRARGESDGPHDVRVSVTTLDQELGAREVALLKIDVEGHEEAVLQGASRLLAENRIRYVIFEEHGTYPTPAMTLLEGHGMSVFTLDHTLLGPRVYPVRRGPAPPGWPGPNYLATRRADEAMAHLSGPGWRSLSRPGSVGAAP